MQSSKHIGTIVKNHAEAVENGKIAARKRKSKASGSSFATVPAHRAFVPMVTIWGGLLMVLIVAVMPDYAIGRASSLGGVYLPLIASRLMLAVGAGCAGACLGYLVARAIAGIAKRKNSDTPFTAPHSEEGSHSRELEPINPTAELGSESLDAPIEEPAFDETLSLAVKATEREAAPGDLSKRGFEMEAPEDFYGATESAQRKGDAGTFSFTQELFKDDGVESCEGAECEPAISDNTAALRPVPQMEPMPIADTGFASLSAEQITAQRKPLGEKPGALDLGAFSAQAEAKARMPARATALETLRQKPTEELSLVEMVERFAAALHDRQTQERSQFENAQKSRDAALAEALKALTLLTESSFDQAPRVSPEQSRLDQTEEELRNALSRLQSLRGAA